MDKSANLIKAFLLKSMAYINVYDMCKAVDRGMRMDGIQLLEKLGGKSGHWRA